MQQITEVKVVSINEIKPHPKNPRLIKDAKFKKLIQSLRDFPEMLHARPIVVNEDGVILGGNMRYKAAKEIGYKEVPVIYTLGWSEEQQDEFMIKDNTNAGQFDWDELANTWDNATLKEWDVIQWDVPEFNPNLIPETNHKVVTANEVKQVEGKMSDRMSDISKVEEMEVCCPDCGSTFYVRK
jgi:ParB-like chromosome segregation protein Spo0J